MKAKDSKAQVEVWEWKEKLSAELKEIPEADRLNYIREKVRKTVERIKANKAKRSAA